MIYGFNTKELPTLSQVGGKAKALIETTQAGFEVPEGFVLSVDFFDSWINKIKSRDHWYKFLASPTKEMCEELKKIAGELTFNDLQKKMLKKELDVFSEKDIFAVRSSSPEEDLQDSSFAGQYETILGVVSSDLERAILKAFTSMLDTRVIEYKKLNNLSLDNPRIAVIVQKQIASEVSGVAFSLNPSNNCYDEVMINASFGLGETIVSGQVIPDTYIVDALKNKVIHKKINEKEIALWLDKQGGTVQRNNENKNEQALTEDKIIMVAELAKNCEKHYNTPIDIEWAFENGKLYLLQARPITTYFNLYNDIRTESGEEKHLYMDLIKLTQGFEDNMSNLGAELFGLLIEHAKQGIMPAGRDGVHFATNGRLYMDLSNIASGFGVKQLESTMGSYDTPTKMIFNSIEFKADGYVPSKKPERLKGYYGKVFKMTKTVIPMYFKGIKNPQKMYDKYFAWVNETVDNLDDFINGDYETFEDIAKDLFKVIGEGFINGFGMIAGIISERNLKKLFKGTEYEREVGALGIELEGNPTSEMGHKMLELAKEEEFKNTKTNEEFIKKINSRTYSDDFMKKYDYFMKWFGCRGMKEIDIATPRADEDLEGLFMRLKAINTEDSAIYTSLEKKKKAYNKLLGAAKVMGKEKKFLKYSKAHHKLSGLREHPKYMYVYCLAKLRKKALQVADQFLLEGRLDNREDIFYLLLSEIGEAQRNPSFDIRKLVNKAKETRKSTKNVEDWPTIFDSRGKIYRYIRESEDGDLVGQSVSPGVVTGRAKVLNSPYEKPLEKGEILVAKATEPSWTPIFINAAGVVMEIGGPLQHGAIIAREYGLPAVTGIYGVTKTIKDGDLLEVDGTSGIVRIVENKLI